LLWRQILCSYKKKSRLEFDENILGGTGDHASAPLTLIAVVANRFAGLVAFRHPLDLSTFRALLVGGRVFSIAVFTNRFAGLVAFRHPLDLSTFRATLVGGRVFSIAVFTNRFAGLPVFVNSFSLPTRVANTLHNLTSFGSWFGFGLKKNRIRSSDLTTYPTLLLT